jgi:hypothetical protein
METHIPNFNQTITIISALLFGAVLYAYIPKTGSKKNKTVNFQKIENQVQNGDIIFRRGRSLESQAVLLYDKEKEFSHVGMIYSLDGETKVIHAVPTKNHKNEWVKLENISTFLSKKNASQFAIYRPNISSKQKQRVVQKAYSFYKQKVVFDNEYNLLSDQQMYCTELIIKAFTYSDIDLGEIPLTTINFVLNKTQIIMPGSIQKNKSFTKIEIQ